MMPCRPDTARRLTTVGLALAAACGSAQTTHPDDVAGAKDPDGLQRYPGAWIVAYAPTQSLRSYEFVTGRVDRAHRQVRVDSSLRVAAQLERVTYRAPAGSRLDDVTGHYQGLVDALGGDVAFTCRGRDCGRSPAWANDVFGVKELVAPHASQFYLAAIVPGDGDATLIAAYIVQRGNQRVYAHVDFARTADSRAVADSGNGVAERLARDGFAVVDGVVPDESGAVDAEGLAALAGLAPNLAGAVLVVCHLAGDEDPDVLNERSQSCAEQAAEHLKSLGVDARGFGGGALLPRPGQPASRLELVAP